MSSELIKTPSRRRLLPIGLAALALAGVVAINGIIQRHHNTAQVAQWTG
jgi:hypothetical protein